MPAATDQTGKLKLIKNCSITVPGVAAPLQPRILPDITDAKSATYNDEPIIGRAFPVKTYAHSDNRTITMKWHIVIIDSDTQTEAITQLNAFRSCVYPGPGTGQTPYAPPAICTISCGVILSPGSGSSSLCVVLKTYNIIYPTDVAWDEDLMMPNKFDIDLTWEVVYASSNLPGNDKIIK